MRLWLGGIVAVLVPGCSEAELVDPLPDVIEVSHGVDGSELVTFRDERKRELFDLPDAPRPDPDAPAPIRFLPDFDNLVLAHDDRTRLIDLEHRPFIVTKNLLVRATYLIEGRVAGLWKVERKKAAATLVLEPFRAIAKKERAALEAEGEALLKFVEEDATVREVRVLTSR